MTTAKAVAEERASQTFYDDWLQLASKAAAEKKAARKVIQPNELQWVRTRQDARSALLIAPENGFRTWGTMTMLAEIPAGWHSGRHSHGEEAIFIVQGNGYTILDGQRFDWEKGACLLIPFGAPHQHFNAGNEPVIYFSAMAPQLEHLCGVADFEQFEDAGKTDERFEPPPSQGDLDADGQRVVLHFRDAPITAPGDRPQDEIKSDFHKSMPKEMFEPRPGNSEGVKTAHLMYPPNFIGREVEITSLFHYGAGDSSPKHAHMEAMLYVVEGKGYSIIDDEKVVWEKGSAFHVQGPQTAHQFFAEEPSQLLRTHFGIRSHLFQPLAKRKFPYLFLDHPSRHGAGG